MQTKINSLNFIFSLYFCCCSEWKDLLNITVLSNVAWPTSVNEPLSLYGPLWTFVFHCSRVHRHHTCLNKMLLGTMHWPEEDVFSTIILQLGGKKEENLIFENEDFLSDSSDNVNPLQLKLNLAAVVLFVPNQWLDIRAHAECYCLSTALCCPLAGRNFFSPWYFFISFFFGLMLPRASFKCLALQKLWETSVTTLTEGTPVFKQTFSTSGVTAGTTACNSLPAVP